MERRSRALMLVAALLTLASGCNRKQAPAASTETPVIPVRTPEYREVTDYVDFTGRADAVQSVDIRARVTGYLARMPFKEGSEVRGDDRLRGGVRVAGLLASSMGQGSLLIASSLYPGQCQEGDLLFEIDPRPYRAQYDQGQSQVVLNEASLALARKTLEIDEKVLREASGGVSALTIAKDQAAVDEAIARVKAYQASMEVYKLNLNYTKVTSPIDGQVSRYYLTAGNVVTQDQTLLTTVVSLDPMYAFFDMDDATLLRIRRAINEGRIKHPSDGVIPVMLGLPGEDDYPHTGRINFVNNQINPTTGSIAVRGIFDNPKPPGGTRLMSPGMYVRIRLPIGAPHKELLVPDKVIQSDQEGKYVYVVESDNKVQARRVLTGSLQQDGFRVVREARPGEGVKQTDLVVTGGLQQVRPKMVVRPELPKTDTTDEPKKKG